MKKKLLFILPSLFLSLVLVSKVHASQILYSDFKGCGAFGSNSYGERSFVSNGSYPVGYFFASSTGQIDEIKVQSTRQFTGSNTVSILDVYSQNILATSTGYSVATVGPSNAYVYDFTFSSPLHVIPQTGYRIQLNVNGGSAYVADYCADSGINFNRGYIDSLGAIEIYDNTSPTYSPILMNLLYPQNSSSSYIHDFTHFSFQATNQDSVSHVFRFQVKLDTTSTFTNDPQIFTTNVPYGFASGATHYLNVPKNQYLATSTIYYAELCAIKDLDLNATCTSPITFQTGNYSYGYQINTSQAGWFGSTTTEAGILYPPATSTDITEGSGLVCGNEFYNPANWMCWAGQRIYSVWNTLKDFATGIFAQGVDGLKVVFPINIISHFNDDLASVSVATSTPPSLTLTGQGTAYKKMAGGYYSFTILTTSSLSDVKTKTGFDWEALVVYLMWGALAIFIVLSALILIQKTSKHTPK